MPTMNTEARIVIWHEVSWLISSSTRRRRQATRIAKARPSTARSRQPMRRLYTVWCAVARRAAQGPPRSVVARRVPQGLEHDQGRPDPRPPEPRRWVDPVDRGGQADDHPLPHHLPRDRRVPAPVLGRPRRVRAKFLATLLWILLLNRLLHHAHEPPS